MVEECRKLQVSPITDEPETINKYGITANYLEVYLPFTLNHNEMLDVVKEIKKQGYVFKRRRHYGDRGDWFENSFLVKKDDKYLYCLELECGPETILSIHNKLEGPKCLDTILRTRTISRKLKEFWNISENELYKRLEELTQSKI
ncbi:MAG: hypothetical protein NC827_08250 [Candidatus Omnitrophica bacterium]|nr:hypothetical protein [Candidatus Omnitrophota bacterium]